MNFRPFSNARWIRYDVYKYRDEPGKYIWVICTKKEPLQDNRDGHWIIQWGKERRAQRFSAARDGPHTQTSIAWNSRLLHDWFQRLQFHSNVSRDSVASLLLCTKVEYNMAGNFVSNKTWERRYKRYVPPEKIYCPLFVCSCVRMKTLKPNSETVTGFHLPNRNLLQTFANRCDAIPSGGRQLKTAATVSERQR